MDIYLLEESVYQSHLQEWLPQHEGQWVVIKSDEILGIYPTKVDAYHAAVPAYGDTPYLVQQICAEEEVLPMPLFLMGHESTYTFGDR